MKDYLNSFYGMLDKLHNWEELDSNSKRLILSNFVDKRADIDYLVGYFNDYKLNLLNNTLNSYIKSVVKH